MDVVAGNPAGVRDLAQHWTQQGNAADEAASTLASAKNDIESGSLRLKGDFAPKIRDAIGDLPGELRKLAQGYRGCGRALDAFATKLSEAQQKSRRARDDWDLAARDKRNAEYDLDQLAPGWDAHAQSPTSLRAYLAGQPEPVMTAVSRRESAERNVDLAERLSRQAAALRGEAERDCVREIKDALEDSGLKNRSWYQKVGDWFKESFTTWDGFVKLCENVALVLGVVALFLTGPLALIVGAILLVAAAVMVADKLMKLARGEIGWGELAFELGMVVLARFGGRALGPAFRRLANSKAVRGLSRQVHKAGDRLADRLKLGDRARNLAHRGICTVTGHPIDVATGKMFTSALDLELPGPLPFSFERVWFSTSTYAGPLGHGWHHSFDAALYVTADALLYRTPDGRLVDLLPLYPDTSFYDRQERITLTRDGAGYQIQDAEGVTRRFAPIDADAAVDDREAVVVHALQEVRNRAAHRITLRRDQGRLVEIVDSGGRELQFEHDDEGRITAVTAPHPDNESDRFAVARYRYDPAGNLSAMTDAVGQEVRYEYDGHLLVSETDRTGLTFRFEYDGPNERARCLRTWGDGGIYERHLSYEPGLTTETNSLGNSTRHEHEGGLVVRTVDALGGETRTEYEYQQPVRRIDPLGRVTAFGYDYRGNRVRTTTADGVSTELVFDERDLPQQLDDAAGGRWAWEYDEAGLLRRIDDPIGRSLGFDYRAGLLTVVTDPVGGVTVLGYDERGLLAAATDPDGTGVRAEYDILGRPITVVDPLGNPQRARFDLLGRPVRIEEADGGVRELSYDGEGDLLAVVDGDRDVRFTRQGMGRLASRTESGVSVRFEYDTEEQVTAIVNEAGRVYSFHYGPTGQVMSERGFDEVLRLFERDLSGRVTTVRRASGTATGYRYDAVDRVIEVSHSDGTGQRFGYRGDGRLMTAENGESLVRFERDVLGRVVREFQGEHWITSEYDGLGRRVRARSSLGLDQQIERNQAGAVTGLAANGFEARFTRDSLGQELARELPGGVRARWSRDQLGLPLRHEVSGPNGPTRDRAYDWGTDGRLRSVVDLLRGPIHYQHDALARLVSATAQDGPPELRMPDAVGNLFRTADGGDRVFGPAGRLLQSVQPDGRTIRYEYDPEGNLITKQSDGGETWRYRWSPIGDLAEVIRPDGSTVEFGYDALGRRVRKTYRGQSTRWVWDADLPVHEWVEGGLVAAAAPTSPQWQPAGVVAQREARLSEFLLRGPPQRGTADSPVTWIFEPETFTPLARMVEGRSESIVTDHLGTPVAMFDQTGAQTWSGELSIWGELRLDLGAAWDCPFRWPGQYEDAETGLYYNRYRYYDPEAGQYVSQDPIGLLGGDQPYSYVSDPLVEIDPYGLIKAPPSLPDVPGIYIIRNGSQSYVGSAGGGAEGMYSRVSDPDHKRAQELLGMDDTTVHYSRVHLGPDLPGLVDRRGEPMTSRAQREQILRHFEQIQMDREEREGQRLTNDRRAQQPHNRPTAIDRIRQRGTRGGVRRRRCT